MKAYVLMLSAVAVVCMACGGSKSSVTTFTDSRDGKVYKIVQIGSQVWFAENLNYAASGSKCYGEDGEVLVPARENGYSNKKTLSAAKVKANCGKYGRMYDLETAMEACPAGFHLPTANEWNTLVFYLGGQNIAGDKLKSKRGWHNYPGHWLAAIENWSWEEICDFLGCPDDGNGTDDYGFSALPGGYRDAFDGKFFQLGYTGYWLSHNANDTCPVWVWALENEYSRVQVSRWCWMEDDVMLRIVEESEDSVSRAKAAWWKAGNRRMDLFSVRCVKD